MEGLFRALLPFIFEFVFETIGEIVGEMTNEMLRRFNKLTTPSHSPPEISVFNKITKLELIN